MRGLKRVLHEPLLHFLLIGAAIFAVHAWLERGAATGRDAIVVTRGRIDSLAARFTAEHGRPPDAAERDALVDGYVREEILCREALALGLDQEDAVIRDRLRQKMEFVAAGGDTAPDGRERGYRDIARRYRVTIEK
jgi:hypothetical protein